ncbi:MAG: alanyl-tRNA editing protein [Candidatus Thermoplasmatota archaeon]|nr:alanyl-tRNA editing protein [Candidatus Thermoplasmatota archaeon]
MTIQLHMDSHEGTYTKKFSARVEATFPGIIELDQTAFYHVGGGQPADYGVLNWDGGKAYVNDVRKKNRIRHFIDGDSPEVGVQVEGEIDWTRRYSHMRMHTSQHLVSAVVNELYNSDTVGNQIGAENSRIDFKPLSISQSEIEHIQEIVNDYVSKDLKVNISEELRSNLENNKDIRSSMSSGLWKTLPANVKKLRVISIGDIDVCPCAGTHVRSLKEIGEVEFIKKKNKGSQKTRLTYKLNNFN